MSNKYNILREAIQASVIGRLGFNTRVKFKGDARTYYVKNVKGDQKSVFVTTDKGLGTYNKPLTKITHINGKPLLESLGKQSLIKESYIFKGLLNEDIKQLMQDEVLPLLRTNKNKIFTVSFIKKDGSKRVMNAMLGVKKYLKGGELPYDAASKGLLPVYDMQKKAYRIITLNSVYNIQLAGDEYIVK